MEAKEYKRRRLVAIVMLVGLCCHPLAPAAERLDSGQRDEIYHRAEARFDEVDLFKPAGEGDDLTFRLAPFILQESGSAGAGTNEPMKMAAGRGEILFGLVETLEGVTPTVYVIADNARLQGRTHPQFTYLWFYAVNGPGGEGRIQAQGVRLTLNSAGEPVIWEVLSDPTGAELVFAAQSLEMAAKGRFGKALPGRRFAIERGVTEAPETVVARVIDDGPVPMGPMVYLRGEAHAVGTLICRCMPAQAKRLGRTKTYELKLISSSEASAAPKVANGRRLRDFLTEDVVKGNRLERQLRLPEAWWTVERHDD